MSALLVIRSPRLKLVAGTTDRLTLQLRPQPRVSLRVSTRGPEGPEGPEGPAGEAGPAGPQGAPGIASAQEYIADEAISALRVLSPTTSGHVQYAQPTDVTPVGISITAASLGATVTVAGSDRVIEDGSWNWTADAPVFCGTDGVLTQTPPGSGKLLVVGHAHSATQIVVRFGQPITLA